MKFSDLFLDEIRARLPVSTVVSRRVPLKRAGREWKGLSPFNQEKTPSFTVNDQKGFYHCFSSGKHGDIFGFVMETEGLSFPEAVERLAGDAGLHMPKPDPQFERIAKERLGLSMRSRRLAPISRSSSARAMAARRSTTPSGAGSPRQRSKDFRIGFAPGSKDALKAHSIKRGFNEAQLLDAGLLVKPDDGRAPYDRFRHRLTIPIVNASGRIVAFGARALDAATEPKYLNSPETKLFDKGSTVFNFARARGPAFDKGELIVVEGYMDVIALHQAGFQHAVATLGTAFTERQMDQLWQLAPEPIICFDGDRAGEAAAARAIDRMLPVCAKAIPSASPFCRKAPTPTTSCATKVPARSRRCLAEARPLIDMLWRRECGSQISTRRSAALRSKSGLSACSAPSLMRGSAITIAATSNRGCLPCGARRPSATPLPRNTSPSSSGKSNARPLPSATASPSPSFWRSPITPGCSSISPRRWRGSISAEAARRTAWPPHPDHLRSSRHRAGGTLPR